MKKSVLKQKLCQALIEASLYEQSCKVLVSELAEVSEALDRRRQLYKSMEELVNRKQPKSMEEMARALRENEREIFDELGILDRCKNQKLSWEELPQEVRDLFYDDLLKIIG